MSPFPATSTVDLIAEIPEELNEALQLYLNRNPTWSQGRVFCAALALFLLQNQYSCGVGSDQKGRRSINRIYLDALFDPQP